MTDKKPTETKELKTTDNVEIPPKHNFMVTVIIAMIVLFTYKHYVEKPKMEVIRAQQEKIVEEIKANDIVLKQDPTSVFYEKETSNKVITINTEKLSGEINLQGAKFNKLFLNKYFETKKDLNNIELLRTGEKPYFVEYGWTSTDRTIKTPDDNTIWSSDKMELTIDEPVIITWDNGHGLIFSKEISVDEDYMFKIKQSVKNESGQAISLTPFTKITKEQPTRNPKDKGRNFDLGPVGGVDDLLEEVTYNKVKKDGTQEFSTDNGWFGFSDKYWFVGSIFADDSKVEITHEEINRHQIFEILIERDPLLISNSSTKEYETKLFAGAKKLTLLDQYMSTYHIPQFDKVISFGWYYFITKPFYYILDMIGQATGNLGIAILIFTILLRIALFPIANKSYASMNKMKLLQPKVKELREKYGQDKQKMQQKLMALYQKEGVSPMGGCLPMLIQIPIFFSLYKVLTISIEMRHAPFFGWIQDLSAPDPTNIFTGFGLIDWTPPSLLTVGIWPLIMGISMFLQQKMNPKPEDKGQAIAMSFMPVVFTFMLARFASGLVIYWTFSNIFAIAQQGYFIKTHGTRKNPKVKS